MKLVPKKLSKYVVKIKKRVFKKDDSSQTCRDYPTPEFESYTECDDDYARKKIEQIASGLNLDDRQLKHGHVQDLAFWPKHSKY